jgi:hypothetical protein
MSVQQSPDQGSHLPAVDAGWELRPSHEGDPPQASPRQGGFVFLVALGLAELLWLGGAAYLVIWLLHG